MARPSASCVLGRKTAPFRTSSGVQLKLLEEVRQATDRANAAAESFSSIIKDIPSDVPHPDGVFRITQASRELSSARAELIEPIAGLMIF